MAAVLRVTLCTQRISPLTEPPSSLSRGGAAQVPFVLHCADLHTPIMDPDMARRLADLVGQEFEAQAEMELSLGLPVSVLRSTTILGKATTELGFIQFVVKPLYDLLVLLAPDLAVLSNRMEATSNMWAALKKEKMSRRMSQVSAALPWLFWVCPCARVHL